jgi:glutamate carboxypeptidase
MDTNVENLARLITGCGKELDLRITYRPTAGVCDGNRLAAAGLPVIDSLGVRGGGLHSSDEYMLIDSLTERAKLTALVLLKLASGEMKWL